MLHKFNLFIFILLLYSSPFSFASGPEICRIQGGHTRTIWGAGFTPGKTEIYSVNIPFDENAAIAALKTAGYKGKDLLPSAPPKESRKLNILACDPREHTMAVEFSDEYSSNGFMGDQVGDDAIWVKNDNGYSKPQLVKASKPWFVYPQKAMPTDLIRIFGRNMEAKLVAVKKIGGKEVRVLKSSTVKNRSESLVHNVMYEAQIRLPADMATGEYELYVHNGSGGVAGWSEPLHLTIQPKEKTPVYYEAKDYGVKSNGYTDDTEALRKALSAAAQTGGVVVLQPGSTVISETIELPAGVSIRGGGEGASYLQVIDENPIQGGFPKEAKLEDYANDWVAVMKDDTPMLWMRNNSKISDLTLVYGKGVGLGILVARCNGVAENIHIERVRVVANTQADDWHNAYSVFVGGNTYGLVIADCDFRGWGSIDVVSTSNYQAYVGRNKMVTFPTGSANTFFTRAFNESILESNEVLYGKRNYMSQNGRTYGGYNKPNTKFFADVSTIHTVLLGNVFSNSLARRHNEGELMIESGDAQWWGGVAGAEKKSITVKGETFDADMVGCYVLILDGKGIGQYRRVISSNGSTLTLDKEWDVIPDKTTYIALGGFRVEQLWIDNTSNSNASWSGFWGNNVGHVVDGHISRDGGPFYLWAWSKQAPATIAFVDIIGSRTMGGGGISLLGSPVFGNTVRYCETIDFRYYPTFHIQPGWLMEGGDPMGKYGISFTKFFPKTFSNIPETAPLNSWNIFEANHIADGPDGIYISDQAEYTIIKRNVIDVDDKQYIDHSNTTVYK